MTTLRFNIDGQDIVCEAGTTILEAARAAGIHIPTLCYFRNLNKLGACRVCVVEVAGAPRLMPSCLTQVKDGMVVRTHSDAVLEARRKTVDLLCQRHRMDCEYCPDYTFCELHAVVRELGLDDRKYSAVYHERQADESSGCIVRDNSKCIRCRRCVAACKAQGVEAVLAMRRAGETCIGSMAPLAETNCIGCGQCVRNCPTGALFVKDDTDLLWRARNQKKKIVLGIEPETAENIGRFFGDRENRNQMERLTAVCLKAGAYAVLDLTGLKAFALAEMAPEIALRREAGERLSASICPGEKARANHREDILWGRAPEAIFREMAADLLQKGGCSAEELFLVYVSACTAAKRSHACDAVLTTAELFQWIQRACVSRFTTLDVWRRAGGKAPYRLFTGQAPAIGGDVDVVYACPGGCRNGGGQFRAQAYQKGTGNK